MRIAVTSLNFRTARRRVQVEAAVTSQDDQVEAVRDYVVRRATGMPLRAAVGGWLRLRWRV
jgi:hypothetical protein